MLTSGSKLKSHGKKEAKRHCYLSMFFFLTHALMNLTFKSLFIKKMIIFRCVENAVRNNSILGIGKFSGIFFSLVSVDGAYFTMTDVGLSVPEDRSAYPRKDPVLLTLRALSDDGNKESLVYSINSSTTPDIFQINPGTGAVTFSSRKFFDARHGKLRPQACR